MKEITTILPGLKLERIQLTFSHDIISWRTFPITFHTAFVACISTSLMKEICFDKVYNIPLNSFADCVGLKRLTLWGYAIPPLNISCKFPHLEALELSSWKLQIRDHPHEFFSWLLTLDAHNIQKACYTHVSATHPCHLCDISGKPKHLLQQ